MAVEIAVVQHQQFTEVIIPVSRSHAGFLGRRRFCLWRFRIGCSPPATSRSPTVLTRCGPTIYYGRPNIFHIAPRPKERSERSGTSLDASEFARSAPIFELSTESAAVIAVSALH